MKQHALSKAFPSMPPTEFSALHDDIKANGQRDPITIYEGMVIDGWHRWQCCEALEIDPITEELPPGTDPTAFVISKNLRRREMSASQRAIAVAACRAWQPSYRPKEVGSTAHLPLVNGVTTHVATNEEMAKEADVSPRTIKDAKAVINMGRAEEVKNGSATINSIVHPPKPKPAVPAKPAPPPTQTADHEDDHGSDLAHELQSADSEIKRLSVLVDSLKKDDLASEVTLWHAKFDSLNGRVQQLLVTEGELKKTVNYQNGVLEKIRKVLGVERNSEILSKLKEATFS